MSVVGVAKVDLELEVATGNGCDAREEDDVVRGRFVGLKK